jgi:hypothetical protein
MAMFGIETDPQQVDQRVQAARFPDSTIAIVMLQRDPAAEIHPFNGTISVR